MDASIIRSNEHTEFRIDFNPQAGRLQVNAPSVFNPGRRVFGRSLINKAVLIPGVRSVSVDLAASACTLQFDPGCDISPLSEGLAGALRESLAPDPSNSRSESGWEVLAAFRDNPSVTFWEARLSAPARLDLRWSPAFTKRLNLLLVADQLAQTTGVHSSRIGFWPRRLLIDFDVSVVTPLDLLHESHQRWIEAHSVVDPGDAKAAVNRLLDPSGFHRIPYLILASGCFLLTLGGLVLPGIPTVPFLVASSYFLARSSPELHMHLLHLPLLGPILQEWERFRGLRTESKDKLLKLGLGILILSAALDPLDPVALGLTLLFSSIVFCGIRSLPTVALPPSANLTALEE